jgi:hypothetical protein
MVGIPPSMNNNYQLLQVPCTKKSIFLSLKSVFLNKNGMSDELKTSGIFALFLSLKFESIFRNSLEYVLL